MTQHGTTASRRRACASAGAATRRQDPGHSRHDARLAWATLLVSGLLLAGCSPSTHSPPAPSTTTRPTTAAVASTPVPSWKFHPTADPINDAYLQFWAAFSDAQARGEPDHPPMIRHANGQALDWAQAVIRGYAARGWVRTIEKGYAPHPQVTRRSSDAAQVVDPQDWTLWPLKDRHTGQILPNIETRQCITAGLTPHDSTWQVTTLVFTHDRC